MDNCSFYSKESSCHQFRHTRTSFIRSTTKYEEIKLLRLRTGRKTCDIKAICSHHEQELLTKFSSLKKKCCDPTNKHPRKSRTKSLRVVSLDMFEKLSDPPCVVVPGVKVCCECLMILQRQKVQSKQDETDKTRAMHMDVDNSSPENVNSSFVNLNSTLVDLDETPIKTAHMPTSTKRTKGKQKLASATRTLKRKLELSYEVPLYSSDSDDEQCAKDYQRYQSVMTQLKEKFVQSQSYQERVQILTLSPFTIDRTMKEFGATNYLVKKIRDVKKQKGILGICDKNKGKTLSEELKNDVCGFYKCDDNSQMCPGMKDSVSVRNKDGEKVQHQKRLVLSNLKELHSSWKETYPEKKIGFSSFAALRPKWCVLAGSSGTHSVCVCKYHQNPKLMAEGCLKSSVRDLMKFCVCSTEKKMCMMGHCKDCPGREGLVDHLKNCEELNDIEDVAYQQWISTDRTKLTTITESKEDFIDNFSRSY
ncbi:CDS1 (predicted) [Pycnogonum litorale]